MITVDKKKLADVTKEVLVVLAKYDCTSAMTISFVLNNILKYVDHVVEGGK